MTRTTLLDFFDDRVRSTSEFCVYDNGYRTRAYTYDAVRNAAGVFARRLGDQGVEPAQKVVIWSENRPEWIVAFWGCVLAGAVVVPVDYRASQTLLARIVRIVGARVVLTGDEVSRPDIPGDVRLWPLRELLISSQTGETDPVSGSATTPIIANDLAEIIFTSGATAEPKGVLITHRNILANIVPVEREVLKYRKDRKSVV